MRRAVRRLALAGGVAAVGFVGVSAFFAWQFTAPVNRPLLATPERFVEVYENVRFAARDGVELAGWFVPCAGATRAVVLLHGNGSTRTQMLARARFFRAQGYAALLYDARGHGESAGSLVSYGWYETRDLLGAVDWLRGRGFGELGCVGASQGGATVALAAAELGDLRWAILESVYPTLPDAVDRRFRAYFQAPGWALGAVMVPLAEWRLGVKAATIAPRESVGRLACPTLIMSGEKDAYTPPEDAREVLAHAREPKQWWLVPGARHVDLYGFAKERYEEKIKEFLASLPAAAITAGTTPPH